MDLAVPETSAADALTAATSRPMPRMSPNSGRAASTTP